MPSVEDAAFKWFDMFNGGRIAVEVDAADLGKRIGQMADIGRRRRSASSWPASSSATAIVMVILLEPGAEQFAGFAYVAMIAFAVTLLVSFVVLFRMLRRHDDEGPTPARRARPNAGSGSGIIASDAPSPR